MKLCGFEVGLDKPLFLIAGPCVVESRELALETAGKLKEICAEFGVPFIFKSSYDKANRSSGKSFRGLGMDEGLKILAEVRKAIGVPVLTDVHEIGEVRDVAAVVDVLQTPAFLCRQTDFIAAVASVGKPVNIKKGQFLAPWDMHRVVAKAREVGNDQILVCERASVLATTIWSPTCARSRSCVRLTAPWYSMPRTRCNCPGAKGSAREGNGNSCPCWPGPRSRPVYRGSSWRPIRTPIGRSATVPTPGPWAAWRHYLRR